MRASLVAIAIALLIPAAVRADVTFTDEQDVKVTLLDGPGYCASNGQCRPTKVDCGKVGKSCKATKAYACTTITERATGEGRTKCAASFAKCSSTARRATDGGDDATPCEVFRFTRDRFFCTSWSGGVRSRCSRVRAFCENARVTYARSEGVDISTMTPCRATKFAYCFDSTMEPVEKDRLLRPIRGQECAVDIGSCDTARASAVAGGGPHFKSTATACQLTK